MACAQARGKAASRDLLTAAQTALPNSQRSLMRAFFIDSPAIAEDSYMADRALSRCTDVCIGATYQRVAGGAAPVFSKEGYVGSEESSTAIRTGMRTKF
jgi:hypothetical protein